MEAKMQETVLSIQSNKEKVEKGRQQIAENKSNKSNNNLINSTNRGIN